MNGSAREPAGAWFWAAIVATILAALLPAYVLSIGPAAWLMTHEYFDPDSYAAIYSPLFTAGEWCPPLGDFLVHWVLLWNPP